MIKYCKIATLMSLVLVSAYLLNVDQATASYNPTVSQVSDSIQYILVNKADAPAKTCCFWNDYVPDPRSINSCDFKDDEGNMKSGRPSSCRLDNYDNAIQ